MGNNVTKLDTFQNSAVYSDYSKFRGSLLNTNISTIIENGIVKEISARSYSNISKQEYLKKTDKDIYSQNNYLKEEYLLEKESEIKSNKSK